jgi:hypothetical protein
MTAAGEAAGGLTMTDPVRAALERDPRHDGGHGPLAAIRRQFPGWRPWRSDAGRYWATRTGRPPAGTVLGGYAMTVDGDTAAELREAIEAQEDRAVPG